MKEKVPSQRQLRAGEEIKHILADTLLKEEFIDPELVGRFVMITEVRISSDFSIATAFVRAIGPANTDTVVALLNKHKGLFRKFLGQNLSFRVTPDIRFLKDESFDVAAKIDALFNHPKVKADIAKGD